MPWKDHPEFVQTVLAFFAMIGAAGVGIMAKIADDVKNGDRPRFWSKELLLEVPALVMMGFVGLAIADYYTLSIGQAVGVSTALGWIGPKSVDVIVSYRLGKKRRKNSEDN